MLRIGMRASAYAAFAMLVAGCHARPDMSMVDRRSRDLFYGAPAASRTSGSTELPPPSNSKVLAEADLGLYLRYGMLHNGALRSAYEGWRANLERIPQVTSLPDPVFSFSQFVETVETRTGPQERRYSLSQTFPWFGKLDLRGSVAGAAAEEQWQRVQSLRLEVERDIRVAYFDYAYLSQSLRITRGVLDLLKQLEPVVQQRIVGAGAGQQDLLRLQVEIGRIENDLASFEKVRPSLSARLAATLNMRTRSPLPLPVLDEPTMTQVGAETESLLRRAEQLNPELRELHERIRKNESQRQLAGLQRWPDVTLGVDYFETGSALNSGTPGSGDDPFGLRLMFNLPIWGAKYGAAEREAEHGIAAATHALNDRRATLRADLEHAAFELDDAARQLVLYRETLLPRARESLEVTRSAYRAGSASVLDLIDSERALLEFETGYWRACRDHYQSQARLEALIGGAL